VGASLWYVDKKNLWDYFRVGKGLYRWNWGDWRGKLFDVANLGVILEIFRRIDEEFWLND